LGSAALSIAAPGPPGRTNQGAPCSMGCGAHSTPKIGRDECRTVWADDCGPGGLLVDDALGKESQLRRSSNEAPTALPRGLSPKEDLPSTAAEPPAADAAGARLPNAAWSEEDERGVWQSPLRLAGAASKSAFNSQGGGERRGPRQSSLDAACAMLESQVDARKEAALSAFARADSDSSSGVDCPAAAPGPAPEVSEVSVAARAVLLTWTRWARNSLRIQAEEQFKVLQHVRRPAAEIAPLSPQPTPRAVEVQTQQADLPLTPPRPAGCDSLTQLGPSRPPAGLPAASRRISRAPEAPKGHFFEALRQEQRQSMDEQAVKMRLVRKLGCAEARSEGTPGFGKDTPSFVLQLLSSDVSRMSSSTSSPGPGHSAHPTGGISPWILEAEALVNSGEVCEEMPLDLPLPGVWGKSPDSLAPAQLPSELPAARPWSELEPIEDQDELDQVELFVNSVGSPPISQRQPQEDTKADTGAGVSGLFTESSPSENHRVRPRVGEAEDSQMPKSVAIPKYSVGEAVFYWSATKSSWLPARVVECRSHGVYLIDKQLRGCFAKVLASELLSEAEELSNPVLRALAAFDVPRARPRSGQSPRRSARSQSQGEAANRPSSRTSTPRLPSALGCVVRDDFSDDSDEGKVGPPDQISALQKDD